MHRGSVKASSGKSSPNSLNLNPQPGISGILSDVESNGEPGMMFTPP